MTHKLLAVGCVAVLVSTSACTGASVRNAARSQDAAYKAHEAVAEKRLEFVDKYLDCVDEAGADKEMVEACDSYLKSAEALS